MRIRNIDGYERWKANNTDRYGRGVFMYVESWANMMEKEILDGASVEDIADRLSGVANTDGITGFMYVASISILSSHWEYGEDLRKWHNSKFIYEGEGIANPTVLELDANKKQ